MTLLQDPGNPGPILKGIIPNLSLVSHSEWVGESQEQRGGGGAEVIHAVRAHRESNLSTLKSAKEKMLL